MNVFIVDWEKWGMVTKDILDLWDAIRMIRDDIESLKQKDIEINADFLHRSYQSIIEKLDVIQKDVDTLKSR